MRAEYVIAAAALLLSMPLKAQDSLAIVNEGPECFDTVMKVSGLPEGCASLSAGPEAITPVQKLEGEEALILVPGVLGTGESLTLRPTMQPAPATDLQVQESDSTLSVRNAFLGLTFSKEGHGGLPTAVEYTVSGSVETDWQWLDRLYEAGQGQLLLHSDPEGSARVVQRGPLQVIVETTGRYLKGEEAPGNARATYRWTFRANSPLIGFSAHVEREDEFAWPELHILQISRKDSRPRNWSGQGREVQSGRLLDDKSAREFSEWGALDDGQNAVALAWDGPPVLMYDGRSSYVTYLQHTGGFAAKTFDLTGRVYIGPALPPEGYARQFGAQAKLTARWLAHAKEEAAGFEGELLTLANDTLSIGFSPETFACTRLTDVKRGHDFLRPPSEGAPATTWALKLWHTDGRALDLLSNVECERSYDWSAEDTRLTLNWENVPVDGEVGALEVTVRVGLAADADRSYWRIDVSNHSTDWSVLEVEFPRLWNVSEEGVPRLAVPRSNWGYLYPAGRAQAGSYPSANWPMQFISLHENDTGLYLGYEDPRNFAKGFQCTPGGMFHYRVPAENATVAGNDFRCPGPVAIGVCGPSWWKAAKMYRRWALRQAWTREGPLTDRQSMPEHCKNLGLWFCGGGTVEQVVTGMRNAEEFFGVPVGLHWYSWHRWPFDTRYADYFPAKPDFKQAIDALVPEGKTIMPYINGRIVDKTVDAYEQYMPWVAKPRDGDSYTEVYGNGVQQAPMCPYTKFWQDKITRICSTLVNEYGVNGIYIDQVGAAGPALCYDPTHGHPIGGGSWWVDGYRKMLEGVQKVAHSEGHDVLITTENNAEPYMDGVDCFLIWNPRHPDEIPMMTAVYSGYTLYFASNARCGAGLQPYAMIEGRDFIWGSQMGWMGFEGPGPRGDYLRQLVRLRHAALKYVVYGEIMGELEPGNDVGTVTGPWHNWQGQSVPATLPAVMGTVWKGSDGTLGLLIANISDQLQRFDLDVDPSEFGPVAGEGDCLLLTDISKEGNVPCGFSPSPELTRTLHLAPWQARVIELKRVTSAEEVALTQDSENDERVQRLKLDLWAAQKGVEWDLTMPPGHVAEQDQVTTYARVKAPGMQPKHWVERADTKLTSSFAPSEEQPEWLVSSGIPIRVPTDAAPGDVLEATIGIQFDAEHSLRVPAQVRVVPRAGVALSMPDGAFRAGDSRVVTLKVTNNRSRDIDAGLRVRIDAPPQWQLWPGSSTALGALAAGQQATRRILCRIPRDATVGAAPLTAYIVESQDTQTVEVAPPPPEHQAAELTPTVDGDLSEWQGLEPLALGQGQAAHVDEYGGADDVSAKVWIATDEGHLYFAADVTDDQHVQPGRHAEIWQGDAIQLALRPGSPPRRNTFDRVIEFGLALGPEGPELWQWMPGQRVVTEGDVQVVREGTHTRYEMAVPWSALPGVKYAPGSATAFSFTVNERDGEQFGGWLEWTPGICGGKDAAQFGILRF